jgi:hypothetical protein
MRLVIHGNGDDFYLVKKAARYTARPFDWRAVGLLGPRRESY